MPDSATENVTPTHIGGQALIEGIMMRGKYNWAVAVRRPDGSIYTEEHDLASGKKKNKWMTLPIIRGCVAFAEAMALSFKALNIAASHSVSAEMEAADPEGAHEIKVEEETLSAKEIALALVGGVGLAVLLFIVLPAVLTNLIVGDYGRGSLTWNLVDGLLRVVAFVGYIWIISRLSDVKRMFGYHGAEHKTIHAHEHHKNLDLENIRPFSTLHVRCGTAFMLMSMIIAIAVFTIVPVRQIIDVMGVQNSIAVFALVLTSRLLLIPFIAGIAYEVTVKWAGVRSENPFVRIILWPGLMLQKLTTNEPDDGMLEVAVEATKLVLAREAREDGQTSEVIAIEKALDEAEAEEELVTHPQNPASDRIPVFASAVATSSALGEQKIDDGTEGLTSAEKVITGTLDH